MESVRKPGVTVSIQLSSAARTALLRPVNGQGGFQSAMRALQRRLGEDGYLVLELDDVEALVRMATKYRSGGFQERLREVLGDLEQLSIALGGLRGSKNETASPNDATS